MTEANAAPRNPTFAKSFGLSLETCPVLADHCLAGRPVVPLALLIEWFAQLAARTGEHVVELRDVRVLRALELTSGGPELSVQIRPAPTAGAETALEIVSVQPSGAITPHARAVIVEAPRSSRAAIPFAQLAAPETDAVPSDTIYDEILFHGPQFRGIREPLVCDPAGVSASCMPEPAPCDWIRETDGTTWATAPLAIDVVFQLGIVWCARQRGSLSLPAFVRSVRIHGSARPDAFTRIELRIVDVSEHRLRADAQIIGPDSRVSIELLGIEWTVDRALRPAFERRPPATARS